LKKTLPSFGVRRQRAQPGDAAFFAFVCRGNLQTTQSGVAASHCRRTPKRKRLLMTYPFSDDGKRQKRQSRFLLQPGVATKELPREKNNKIHNLEEVASILRSATRGNLFKVVLFVVLFPG
jgi:hypothetical protein